MVKKQPANAGDTRTAGSGPGLGRSPGEGNGNPLQYSCLEYSMDRRAWQATVHGVTESDMTWQLNSERALLKASVTCTAHCQGTVNLIITYVGVSKECAVLSSPVETK